MGMSNDEYNNYKRRIQDCYYHGTREDCERIYSEIIARYGYCDDLYDLDKYQGHWTILPPR
ncbi:hypothetical protein [Butyrivibrio sp. VCB2001]|uniref:hypothetical protein n=1 Tax=Butyrivibrio sp. VCB2001 TaxID=1280667 RepID=UPI000419C683|nr:hypothetical protein [Butyrivibrio sp. VCB2001]